mmetsp:Transcript_160653/g.511082  ORF Transcript_160653/g.511082 Transcript_160653/m.511082 type:complete len:258 (+) Transcript_160653:40-813(+)
MHRQSRGRFDAAGPARSVYNKRVHAKREGGRRKLQAVQVGRKPTTPTRRETQVKMMCSCNMILPSSTQGRRLPHQKMGRWVWPTKLVRPTRPSQPLTMYILGLRCGDGHRGMLPVATLVILVMLLMVLLIVRSVPLLCLLIVREGRDQEIWLKTYIVVRVEDKVLGIRSRGHGIPMRRRLLLAGLGKWSERRTGRQRLRRQQLRGHRRGRVRILAPPGMFVCIQDLDPRQRLLVALPELVDVDRFFEHGQAVDFSEG